MATPTLPGSNTYSRAAGTTTKTVSHTIPSGTDMLVVFADDGNVGGGDITGVTYNGTAMTRATAGNVSSAGYQAGIFYLLSASLPATGSAYNIVVTYPATTAGTTPVVCAVNVSGAKQAAPDAAAGLYIGTIDPITTATITTGAASTLILQAIIGVEAITLTAFSDGQTTVNNQSARIVGSLTGPATPGAQSMNANLSGAFTNGASLLISIEGASAPASVSGVGTTPRRQSLIRRFGLL